MFDRVTGQPVWPIEDRPVPASSVPGESAASTQPYPTRPAPIDIQGVHEEDLIDVTPALRKEAVEIVARYDHGPLFTPPSQRGTIQVPGIAGGASWSGAAIDPETGMLYVGTYRLPFVVTVRKPTNAAEASYDYIGQFRYLPGPRGLPLLKPPFGSIVAIDMNTGEHRWRVPVGRGELLFPVGQRGVERLGFAGRSWALVTKTVMIVVQMGYSSANFDPHLWVYDKATGEMLAEIPLPANATGSPITYMTGGKQYVVFPVGGGPLVEELLAIALGP